jgi:hypothetical protein
MRILGLAFAGALAVSFATPGHANPAVSRMEPARPALGIVKVWDGNGPGWHHAPAGGQTAPGQNRNWRGGWVSTYAGPHHHLGGWSPYGAPEVPTYWVYVPGSAVFDYPFADWRGPMGGWGNP